jgi:hypothetical protein
MLRDMRAPSAALLVYCYGTYYYAISCHMSTSLAVFLEWTFRQQQ